MKVGIILLGDFRVCPYSRRYIETLQKNNIDFDVILWHRIVEEDNSKYYGFKPIEYNGILNTSKKIGKIKYFLGYRKFIKKVIKENKYDKLIVLTTLTAVLLGNVLTKDYKKKYLFDFRDITYERFGFYKKRVNKIIGNAACTIISSAGFKNVLGDRENMLIAHNFSYYDIEHGVISREFKKKDKLNIVYIGMIKYEMCKRTVEMFGNDDRFTLTIHGGGDRLDDLKSIAKQYSNVVLTGAYKFDQKPELLKNADMLPYFYPVNDVNRYAIANKFYDGMIYKIPTIGNNGTYSGKKVVELGVGCGINWDDDNEVIKTQILDYYNSIYSEKFNKNANDYINQVVEDDKKYLDKIEEFIKA